MGEPLIGPGENDYGRQKPPAASLGFNPCEGDPKTTAQMEAVIVLRNAQAIDDLIKEIREDQQHPMMCKCGFAMIGMALTEVASYHFCPNCRKMILEGPEIDHDVLKEITERTPSHESWAEAYWSVGRALGDQEPEAAGLDHFASEVKKLIQKIAAARDGLKAADVALSRDFHPESYARRKVADALKASE
jgi:hypothetical protein